MMKVEDPELYDYIYLKRNLTTRCIDFDHTLFCKIQINLLNHISKSFLSYWFCETFALNQFNIFFGFYSNFVDSNHSGIQFN